MAKNQRRELQDTHVKRLMAAPTDSVRRRWKRWLLGRLSGEVAEIFRHIEIYETLVAMVKANDALLKPPIFFIWLKNSYVTAIAMGIRRQLDCDPRSVSLGILLRESELRPDLISRKCFRAMMRRKGLTPEEADGDLRRRIGSTTFKAAMATADIRRLERAEHRIGADRSHLKGRHDRPWMGREAGDGKVKGEGIAGERQDQVGYSHAEVRTGAQVGIIRHMNREVGILEPDFPARLI